MQFVVCLWCYEEKRIGRLLSALLDREALIIRPNNKHIYIYIILGKGKEKMRHRPMMGKSTASFACGDTKLKVKLCVTWLVASLYRLSGAGTLTCIYQSRKGLRHTEGGLPLFDKLVNAPRRLWEANPACTVEIFLHKLNPAPNPDPKIETPNATRLRRGERGFVMKTSFRDLVELVKGRQFFLLISYTQAVATK